MKMDLCNILNPLQSENLMTVIFPKIYILKLLYHLKIADILLQEISEQISKSLATKELIFSEKLGFQYLKGAYRGDVEGLFIRVCKDRTSGFQLKEGRFRLLVWKKFFTVRVMGSQNNLPIEAGNTPSLKMFKARSDGALGNLVQWKVLLPTIGSWNKMILKVLSNPNHTVIT